MKLASLFVLAALVFPASSSAADLPKRKPGMWEITVSPSEGLPPSTMKQCIDETTDAKMQTSGTEMIEKMGGKCSKNSMQKTAIGYIGEAICEFNGSKMVAKTMLRGDFTTTYSGEVSSRFDPPLLGQAGSTVMKISARYLGSCETGMSPGDMLTDGGQKVNLDSLTQFSEAASEASKGNSELNKLHHDILRQLEKK